MRLRLAAAALLLALSACTGAAVDPADGAADQDVRGVYAVAWDDRVTVRLDIGGAVQEAEAEPGGFVTFDGPDGAPLVLDLGAWCADPAVNCPGEAWPTRVALDQDHPDLRLGAHPLRAWDAETNGDVVTGAVDHATDRLLFGLDAGSGANGNCGVVAVSLAGGTFLYPEAADSAAGADSAAATDLAGDTARGDTAVPDTTDPFAAGVATEAGPVGIVDGEVAMGWLGLCAWEGLAVGATLSVSTGFQAVRVGPLE